MAARVPIKTGIRYRGESAATGQYPIAAKYTGSAASQAFVLSAMPIANPQGFWYCIDNILPLG
ncbi:hypothetical protein [Corynebacterium striatum]|uniref:hypothetical protein n=1 Tax=Corynebacterium striatum TaxID=43770 RepID=UPI0011C04604|nr:hypothetical protein [Corynebacterium striatum]MDK8826915.1 hypothetical protein [Corynebacterium striatum]MDK8878072.1 hypothetical protein [Corynebacterium striatum]HAT1277062.1 hypothetical protein [Corynebacterium striatum]HAT1321773.1 hypothetical protein [Corynebacterium striatum]HAT1420769.1 hypothetical protein [Corynebacterium striatum]